MNYYTYIKLIISFLLFLNSFNSFSQAITTTLRETETGHQLMRNDAPYFIKGAGGQANLDKLSEYGGNSIRTWGTDENTIAILDAAHAQGLTVCMGLWVGHQEHGFDYNNEAAVANQLAQFTEMVGRYKDHPAVLLWAIGNEVELGTNESNFNPKVWDAINDISLMIHELDGKHPTLTVTAGISTNKANQIAERAPDLDLIGVNAYGGIGGVHQTLENSNFEKPYIISEWGPNGQWEVAKTNWGAPVEQTSTQKAIVYGERYDNHILAHEQRCLGSYVFLWGEKFEQTATWYGLFFDQYETETVAVMQEKWSGTVRENMPPKILSFTINGKNASENAVVDQEKENIIQVEVEDESMQNLTYQYSIQPEQGNAGVVSSEEYFLPYLPDLITSVAGNEALFTAPSNYENYRIFVFVVDDAEQIAMANIPVRVNLAPFVSTEAALQYPVKDAYLQGGEFAGTALGKEDPLRLLTRKGSSESTNRKTILSFNLSLAEELSSEIILSVYGGNSTGIQTMVSGVNTAYNEERITLNNFVSNEIQALDTVALDGEVKYHEWNVTEYVNQLIAEGASDVHFILENVDDSPNPTSWESREVRENTPMLTFQFDGRSPTVLSNNNTQNRAQLVLYPNPGKNLLHFKNTSEVERIEFLTLQGRSLTSFSIKSDNTTKDISELPHGLYLVKAYLKNGSSASYKFIKE